MFAIKKIFHIIFVSFIALPSFLAHNTLESLLEMREAIVKKLDSLHTLQDYYAYESTRNENFFGTFKHKLDSIFFKHDLSTQAITTHQRYITKEIDLHTAFLADIQRSIDNPSHELSLNKHDKKLHALPLIPHPNLLKRHSAKLYFALMCTYALIALSIYRPHTPNTFKTAISSLSDLWNKGFSSLKILLGLKENPLNSKINALLRGQGEYNDISADFLAASKEMSYEQALEEIARDPERVKFFIKEARKKILYERPLGSDKTFLELDLEETTQLTQALNGHEEQFRAVLDELPNLNLLALLFTNPEDAHIFLDNVKENRAFWLWFLGIGNGALEAGKKSNILSQESLSEGREIIRNIIEIAGMRATNLSQTGAGYQRVAQRLISVIILSLSGAALDVSLAIGTSIPFIEKTDTLLNIAFSLIPISCAALGGYGLYKLWNKSTAKFYESTQEIIYHLELLFTAITPGTTLSDVHLGKIVYWTHKLEKMKNSLLLSEQKRKKIEALLSYLRNEEVAPQHKALLLARSPLV